MKLRLIPVSLLVLAPLSAGCSSHDDYYDQYPSDPYAPPENVLRMSIDTNQTLQADPGEGAGLFVEYAEGGEYHVFATCDTNHSDYNCGWSIVASIDPTLSMDFTDDGDLEKGDEITRIDQGAVRLDFLVGADFDGVVLKVPPGERFRLNWLLDSVAQEDKLSWVSEGAVKTGAPSDPLDLEPTSP